MSKIAEKKALEAYPKAPSPYYDDHILDRNVNCRAGYIKGYDQAIQDMVKDSDHFQYLSDEMGYAYACGCRKTMQDFMEKVCEWLEDTELENFICRDDGVYFDNEKLIEQFKNYMQNE